MSGGRKWNSNLKNPDDWQPRADDEALLEVFYKRCKHVEQVILCRAKIEKEMNIDNFDSGLGLEDIIREELSKICPNRYSICSGVIDDSKGQTAGDFEILISNNSWFTSLKYGATEKSRRYHYPIESIYSVIEIKQTLTYSAFDEAMKKLVACNRLYRVPVEGKEKLITENRYGPITFQYPSQPFSAIISTSLGKGIRMEDIDQRFFEYSKKMERSELVRSICVLGQGTINWGFINPNGSMTLALTAEDYNKSIRPVWHKVESEQDSAFYPFIYNLLYHLSWSVLPYPDMHTKYGPLKRELSYPDDLILDDLTKE